MKERMANLLTVKSLVTIVLTGVFAGLSLMGKDYLVVMRGRKLNFRVYG